jgi:hypothetical protein
MQHIAVAECIHVCLFGKKTAAVLSYMHSVGVSVGSSFPAPPVSTQLISPSYELLKAELDMHPGAGVKTIRRLLKEKHPHWQLSESRVCLALRGKKRDPEAEASHMRQEVRALHCPVFFFF